MYRTVAGTSPSTLGVIGKVAFGSPTTGASCSASTCVYYDAATTGDATTAQAFNSTGTVVVGTGTVIGCAAGSTCGGSIYGPGGVAPTGTVSSGAGIYFSATPCVDIINGTVDKGCAATLSAAQSFTAAETFTGGIVNTTTPVRDQTRQVLVSSMTAVSTAGVNIGSTGASNATFSWPVTAANWYDMQCKLPVTFVASATIKFQLVSISGAVTISNVNSETTGNTGAAAAFQDLNTIAGTTLATSVTPITGAPGGVSEMISYNSQFLTSHAGNIGLEFIGNGTNNVQMLLGGECGLTQIN